MSDKIVIAKAGSSIQEALISELTAIEAACFSDPWSAQAFKSTLENPSSEIYIARDIQLQKAAGFCAVMYAADESEILNIAVIPEMRRRGIGKALLNYAITELKKLGASAVFLEVRASNSAAIKLYEKLGFNRIGMRRNYYRIPAEDAVLMERSTAI